MVSGPDLYGILLLLTVFPAGWLLHLTWDKREKPGGRWLALLLVGMAGWSVSWALVLLFDDPLWSLISADALLLFVDLSVVGWFVLSLEFTRQRRYALRYVLPLFAVPLVTLVLAGTDPSHSLLWGPELSLDATELRIDGGPWFVVHVAFSYLLLLVSGVLLVNNHTELDGIYRKQSAVLIAGWSVPLATSLAYNFGAFPQTYLNPTPLGFLVGAALWGWGQHRFRLLEIAPVARRRALDELDEAVVAVNEDGVVAYVNDAAVAMFDLEPAAPGRRLPELLSGYPEILDRLGDADEIDEEMVLERDGRRRYVSVKKTALGHGGGTEGSVVVCEDVSELKRHERDLELLKQVFARVFRHDLSNDLNVIRAHGELLSANIDGPRGSHAETIVRTCDDVIETSRKARAIEKLVDVDRDRYETDLVHVVSEVVDWLRGNFDDATVETDLPRDGFVLADGELELAVRCLLENAVAHNDSSEPWVRVVVTERPDEFVLTVEDDGPGIGPNERHVFEDRQVDPLSHSNGLGLWTVNWVVRNSGGDARFECTDRGTKFELRLERAYPADATTVTRGG